MMVFFNIFKQCGVAVSDLHHAHIKDLDFLAVLSRLWLWKCCRTNTTTISTCWFKKHLVNEEIWETPFIIGWSKGANIDIYLEIFVCLCSLRWANAYQHQASLLRYRILFLKRFVLQTNSCISCTAEAKVLFKTCLWAKSLLSIANSTSRCSA